ncbi:COX15/CtaA family protein [Oricola thermophila]|uniref:Heme A synthase n=2 Tax=Oricola thermophila TaxID=2742145 RepID=A0A6N1VL79_9HYPH|nr:COX15/CtaA family protein [Oricola thermophila]QKV20575.1 COX15/CtaA family protein [Oricola thermophila]
MTSTDAAATGHPKPPAALETELRHRAQVRGWLYVMLAVLIALVIVGGATRLTDSGLSITEWKPIHGVIPPIGEEQWQEEFAKYRQIPEYELVNKGMSLAEFKAIFWWEWAHRLLARGVGLVFALPLAFFWATGRLDPRLKLPLTGILALGGLQGFIGWWMVSSGLTERVDVSHYRLAVHLMMASFIFAACMWVARGIAPHGADLKPTARSDRVAGLLVLLVFVQIYLGALVAGLDAGLVFNEWPTMDNGFFPASQWDAALGWRNVLDTPAVVQFVHRTFAYVVWLAALAHAVAAWRWAPGSTHARRAVLLLVLVTMQAVLGIVTLLTYVPMGWALLHQAMALVVLGFAVAHWRGLKGPLPLSDGTPHRLEMVGVRD